MDRRHDVGGGIGEGAIVREALEPPFHHEWEARVFALNRLLLARGVYNLDEFRFAVERLPSPLESVDPHRAGSPLDPPGATGARRSSADGPPIDVTCTYYGRWLAAMTSLLHDKGIVR